MLSKLLDQGFPGDGRQIECDRNRQAVLPAQLVDLALEFQVPSNLGILGSVPPEAQLGAVTDSYQVVVQTATFMCVKVQTVHLAWCVGLDEGFWVQIHPGTHVRQE